MVEACSNGLQYDHARKPLDIQDWQRLLNIECGAKFQALGRMHTGDNTSSSVSGNRELSYRMVGLGGWPNSLMLHLIWVILF